MPKFSFNCCLSKVSNVVQIVSFRQTIVPPAIQLMLPNKCLFGRACLFVCLFFGCSTGCPGTYSVDKVGLEFRDPLASLSQVLGLKVWPLWLASKKFFWRGVFVFVVLFVFCLCFCLVLLKLLPYREQYRPLQAPWNSRVYLSLRTPGKIHGNVSTSLRFLPMTD